jgi:hypothetical protein
VSEEALLSVYVVEGVGCVRCVWCKFVAYSYGMGGIGRNFLEFKLRMTKREGGWWGGQGQKENSYS